MQIQSAQFSYANYANSFRLNYTMQIQSGPHQLCKLCKFYQRHRQTEQLCKFNRLNSVMQIMQIHSGSIQLCKFNRARINYANCASSISIIHKLNNSSGSTTLEAARRFFPAVPLGVPVSLALALAPFRNRRSWGRASDRASKQQTHFGQQC